MEGSVPSKFVRYCLSSQYVIGKKILNVLKKDVYLFNINGKFNGATTKLIDGYRYVENEEGDVGVLSVAAQETFPSVNTYNQFVVNNTDLVSDNYSVIMVYTA